MKKAIVAVALLLAAAATPALAQGTYPDKPIRVVVPFGAGSGPDALTRLITAKMQPELGQQFVIENRPGAGGAIGTAYGKTLAADGYNLTWWVRPPSSPRKSARIRASTSSPTSCRSAR